ncbi:hypothetical protein [Rariglobus hedericola]|uniref:Uncharacterized protein n=1 Tax=Rariglobus hedericola TaxID=2597822 RepID=A0A556QQH7_9BACT|nr:hypothetical protein [Rariglobus hedericola]TSJ78894.1 hypothetical protein FPL22_06205 [Rariglobus hedericola]
MSSEWWSILAVFWGLYLADGLRGGRRDRLFFYAWFGDRTSHLRVTQSSWFLIPPLSDACALIAEDLPASLAPEGLTNWPSVSASRPPPLPQHVAIFRWEDIQRIEDRSGWIFINERRFTPASPGLTAKALEALARELAPLSPEARTTRLTAWQTGRFSSARLRRRFQSIMVRSRSLAFLNTVQLLFAAGLSAYVLLDVPSHIPPVMHDALVGVLPVYLVAYAAAHVTALVLFYRLHRRFFPKAGQERASALFTALLVPPQALRLRLHLTAKLAGGLHPLAVALACSRPGVAQTFAADTLRDLHWPLRPAGLPADISALADSSARLLEPVVLAAFASQTPPVSPDDLLAPPLRESPEACAYCPRCGDQFTRPDSHCSHGVALLPLPPIINDRRS